MLSSAEKIRQQGTDAEDDELWVDAPPRYAVKCAVMATAHADGAPASGQQSLTRPLVREANHAERNHAAAISEMMPAVYDDLRRLAETFLRGERTAHTRSCTKLSFV